MNALQFSTMHTIKDSSTSIRGKEDKEYSQ